VTRARGATIASCLFLCACAARPPEPIAVQIGAPPPAPPAPPARPEPPQPTLAPFAEGYGLSIAILRGAPVLYDEQGEGIAIVEGEQIHMQRRPFEGLIDDPEAKVNAVFGHADAPWALVQRGGRELPRLLRARGGGWRDGRAISFADFAAVRVASWTRDKALVVLDAKGNGGGAAFDVEARPEGAQLTMTDPGPLDIAPTLAPVAVAANPEGDVVVLGTLDPEKKRHALEIFRGGASPGEVAPLPDITTDVEQVDVAMCLGRGGAIHVVRDVTTRNPHDGKRNLESVAHVVTRTSAGFSVTPMPRSTAYYGLRGCAVDSDDALWVAFDATQDVHPGDARLERLLNGAWSRVALPSLPRLTERARVAREGGRRRAARDVVPVKPAPFETLGLLGVQADDAGTVWVRVVRVLGGVPVQVGGLEPTKLPLDVVLRVGPARPGGPISWDAAVGGAVEAAIARADRGDGSASPVAATPACKAPWVKLATAPPDAASPYHYPELAAAVRARPDLARLHIVEGKILGLRAAFVAAPDLASARAIAEKMKRALPKAPEPEIECGPPPRLRPAAL
jgi:hypothetical protein